MQKWEYLVVYCVLDGTEWRPWYAGGEIPDWRRHTIDDYINTLGTQGWELVNVMFAYDRTRDQQAHQLYFKRPKS